MAKVWRNNSLSIVLFALFLICMLGHAISGWKANNEERQEHGESAVTFRQFVSSSEFGETVFENWESEFLQMGFYVILTAVLLQRGSAESKKGDGSDEVDEPPEAHRKDKDAPGPVRAGGWRLALYKVSLSLALFALFFISFFGHAIAGAQKYNQEQLQHGQTEHIGAFGYMGKALFWYESFQNWQSEFLAVFAIVVLSIWLRQYGSQESKPVHAPHRETESS
jgi:hypothetical protein